MTIHLSFLIPHSSFHINKTLLLPLLILLPLLSSCERGSFVRDSGEVTLTFSNDTISFDTVFTTIGTATKMLTVYNRSDDNLTLSSITLAGGRVSRFRLNVDGDTTLVAKDVEIESGDSIFVFVQACIDPNDNESPFLVEDAIVFSNGQRLTLQAWGRNAIYHITPRDSAWVRIGSETWGPGRPHVIIGNLLVSEDCTLRMTAGTEVYLGPDAMLIVDSAARLVAQGTAEEPVIFSSLRSDGWYSFLPGQWQTIWFYNYSRNNIIDHAVIENGTGGLRCYPNAQLTVSNTVIRNMSDAGIIGQGGTISGRNLLVYDCLTSLTVLMGGSYDFRRCTMANYWGYSARKLPTVILSNQVQTRNGIVGGDLLQADFTDCIVWGTYSTGELLMSEMEGYAMNHRFNHSILRGGDWNEDPLFTDPAEDDYTLQEESPAKGLGYQASPPNPLSKGRGGIIIPH